MKGAGVDSSYLLSVSLAFVLVHQNQVWVEVEESGCHMIGYYGHMSTQYLQQIQHSSPPLLADREAKQTPHVL